MAPKRSAYPRLASPTFAWLRQWVLMLLLAFVAFPAVAGSTYIFTSPNYSSVIPFTAPCTMGVCANYTTSMHPAGSFTTASPLPANLVGAVLTNGIISFVFTDGINTYASSDPNSLLVGLTVSTDASGVPIPTSTSIRLEQTTALGRLNELFVGSSQSSINNELCLHRALGFVGCLLRSVDFPLGDPNSSQASTSVAGTWQVVSSGPTPTTTSLSAAPNPAPAGQTVTFTATITGSSPGGTVQFKDGATNLGSPAIVTGGVATLATSTLTVGTHSITAVYGGDANNLGSTSPAVNEVVSAVVVGGAVTQSIPTLSEGALALLALLIGLGALAHARSRMR